MLAAGLSCPRGAEEGVCPAYYPSFTVVCFWLPNNINNIMKGDISGTLPVELPHLSLPLGSQAGPLRQAPFPPAAIRHR